MLKNLGKSFLIYGLAAGLSKSFAILLVPIYTRIFSPAQYGIIDVITTVLTLASLCSSAQLESAVARYFYEVGEGEPQVRLISTSFWAVIVSGLLWMLLIALLADELSQLLFGDPEFAGALRVAAGTLPFMNLYGLFTVVIRFRNLPVLYGLCSLLQILSTIGLSVWFIIVAGLGIRGAFYGLVSGYGLAVLSIVIILKRFIKPVFDWGLLIRLLKYSLPATPAAAGTWANGHLNRFVMLAYLTLADIGIYNVALKIASVFYLLDNAFRMAWQPFFWKTLARKNHRQIYRDASMVITTFVLSLVVVLALFSREVLILLVSPEYFEAAPLIGLIGMAIGLNLISKTLVVGTEIVKKTGYNIIIYLGAASVNLCATLVLVPSYGLAGVPTSLLLGSITLIIVGWYYSEKKYRIGFSKIFFAALSTMALIAVLILVHHDFHWAAKAVLSVAGLGFIARWGWRRLMQYETHSTVDNAGLSG
jgi:O-antigen/teichoic acid export membrane protein